MSDRMSGMFGLALAGAMGFATAHVMWRHKQREAGCPRAQISGIPKQGPFKEFSVVYTDRAMNLMSPVFTVCMQDISRVLKSTYNADAMAMIPGSGTYAMESVAR